MVFDNVIPGHWDTPEGTEMANEYAGKPRDYLGMSFLSDLAMANEVFMHGDMSDHQNIAAMMAGKPSRMIYVHAAKDRIRWLSVQLAIANQKLKDAGIE